jgi:cytochrome c-type biogenesis protein CcmH/NrfG
MESEIEHKVLRQLIWIKWLTAVLALSFATITVGMGWSVWLMQKEFGSQQQDTSFSDQANDLLDRGKEQEVLSLAAKRETEFPKDANVFWYRGRALYQLGQFEEALTAFAKAEYLAPSWKTSHTEPYISASRLKLNQRIPPTNNDGSPSVRPSP